LRDQGRVQLRLPIGDSRQARRANEWDCD